MTAVLKHIYRVGDLVKFKMGANVVTAEVVEDRGKIGPGGEQIVRVAVPIDSTYHVEVDLSASLVDPVHGRAKLL